MCVCGLGGDSRTSISTFTQLLNCDGELRAVLHCVSRRCGWPLSRTRLSHRAPFCLVTGKRDKTGLTSALHSTLSRSDEGQVPTKVEQVRRVGRGGGGGGALHFSQSLPACVKNKLSGTTVQWSVSQLLTWRYEGTAQRAGWGRPRTEWQLVFEAGWRRSIINYYKEARSTWVSGQGVPLLTPPRQDTWLIVAPPPL